MAAADATLPRLPRSVNGNHAVFLEPLSSRVDPAACYPTYLRRGATAKCPIPKPRRSAFNCLSLSLSSPLLKNPPEYQAHSRTIMLRDGDGSSESR